MLTNYHVLVPPNRPVELKKAVDSTKAVFGYFHPGGAPQANVIGLDGPVLAWSPTEEDDFVLLRLDTKVQSLSQVKPVPVTLAAPDFGSPLYLIQHPHGGALELSVAGNGVGYADVAGGRLQYLSETSGGSSGAPCFNSEWRAVALHQAAMPNGISGELRQGILLEKIYLRIRQHLSEAVQVA